MLLIERAVQEARTTLNRRKLELFARRPNCFSFSTKMTTRCCCCFEWRINFQQFLKVASTFKQSSFREMYFRYVRRLLKIHFPERKKVFFPGVSTWLLLSAWFCDQSHSNRRMDVGHEIVVEDTMHQCLRNKQLDGWMEGSFTLFMCRRGSAYRM